jgi:hypothetical protein
MTVTDNPVMNSPRGDRQSEWLVIARCLAVLRRLMLGDANTSDLIAIIREYEDQAATPSDEQLHDKMEKDIKRLRDSLHHDIQYIRAEKVYHLAQLAHPLIDLPDESLRALAFLEKTFSDAAIPYHDEVMKLLHFIRFALPEARAEQVGKIRGLLEVELNARDSKAIAPELLEKVSRACSAHHEIEFLYLSPRHIDGKPRRHRVEPYRLYLEPVRRHYMLDAFQLEISEPYQKFPNRMGSPYRLERISDLKVLPKRFVPRQLRPEGKEIIYRLAPSIARLRDIIPHIPESQIEYLPDGSAEVYAVSYNLFNDLRGLLHYGANCQVLGGEEALAEMKKLVHGLSAMYAT